MLAFFFDRMTPAARQTHTVHGPVSQGVVQFLSPTANGTNVHTCDLGHPRGTTTPQLLGFQGYIPTSLLFVQAAEEQIHLLMEFLVRMFFSLLAIWTLALVHRF
jgi:hypothetical protein